MNLSLLTTFKQKLEELKIAQIAYSIGDDLGSVPSYDSLEDIDHYLLVLLGPEDFKGAEKACELYEGYTTDLFAGVMSSLICEVYELSLKIV